MPGPASTLRRLSCLVALLAALPGCGTTGQSVQQSIWIETLDCASASCELRNDRGQWTLERTPGSVTVTTSSAPLEVACRAGGTDNACQRAILVRFDDNDYSVPVDYAHHEILAKGYVERVALCHKDRMVAEHVRSWGKEGVFFDYRHYLRLLERKPGSLDHARPLMDLHLPECLDTLRRRLEGAEEKKGAGLREFIRVLRLLEDHSMAKLREAVEKALVIHAHSRDAVLQFLVPRFSWRNTTFLLDGRKHLRLVKAAQPDLSAYGHRLSKGGVR